MSDELLARATRALREETSAEDAGARFTRSRIMASVHEQRVRRRTRAAFLLPLAATFLAASAWGAASGKLGRAVDSVARAFGVAEPAAPSTPAPKAPLPRRQRPALISEPPPTPAPAADVLPVPPTPSASEAASVSHSPPASPPAPTSLGAAGIAGAAASDPALDLYRVAHRTHFVERDSARALDGWDAYLRAAPNGALALEARYNRALCLVRLQRNTEARAALEPFARGRYGTYRQQEAASLLAALP